MSETYASSVQPALGWRSAQHCLRAVALIESILHMRCENAEDGANDDGHENVSSLAGGEAVLRVDEGHGGEQNEYDAPSIEAIEDVSIGYEIERMILTEAQPT